MVTTGYPMTRAGALVDGLGGVRCKKNAGERYLREHEMNKNKPAARCCYWKQEEIPVIRSEEDPQLESFRLGKKHKLSLGTYRPVSSICRLAVAASLDLTARRWDMGRTMHGQA
jgi:hypothetical protein